MATRNQVANLANSYLGTSGGSSKHKEILAYFNKLAGTSFGTSAAWCAMFTVTIMKKCGVDFPVSASCTQLINLSKKKGIWVEDDSHMPKVGDACLYEWSDGSNYANYDQKSDVDHIGIVTAVSGNTFVVTEGNYGNAVRKRTVTRNGRYIRGFITPKYDEEVVAKTETTVKKSVKEVAEEVINGKWGNGNDRKNRLVSSGYNYDDVQTEVNKILADKKTGRKTATEVAKEVVAGKWGNGDARKSKLKDAGYDPVVIQSIVNNLLRK